MSEGFFRGMKGKVLLGTFLALLVVLLLVRWGVALYVDFLWFSAEGATQVYVTRYLWEWGGRVAAGVVVALLTWVNMRIVVKTFAGIQIRRRFGDLVIQEQLPESYVRWAIWAGCALVGLWFAAAVPQGTGTRALLLLNAPEWGVADPILGRDLSFYLFHLPVIEGLVTFGMVVTVFLTGLVAAGYSATGAIQWGNGRVQVRELPRLHLGALGVAFLLLLAVRFQLAPFGLVQDGTSGVQGIFGYADHQARIPAYRILVLLTVATAAAGAWAVVRNRLVILGGLAAALALATIVAGQMFPAVVQRFQVEPNELARETPYIEHAIEHTRLGFDLEGLIRERLPYAPPSAAEWALARERLARLPIWTEMTLLATFRQIEARFRYYDFHRVAFDRYPVGGRDVPIAVSVREVDPNEIPDPNWQNLHLRERYISGMGAVAGQLHRQTAEGRLPMFLTGIPPEYRGGEDVPEGLSLTRTSVYVGSRPQLHAVINPEEGSFLAPDGTPGQPGVDYPEGILVGSLLRTAALAWHFQDANLLFAREIGPESRFVFRREVRERVRALAPFLLLPEDPYPVVADGRIVWILEGFTVSRSFPLSTAHQVDERQAARYLRNSVKATVDAVTGETRLYVVEPDDRLIQAYRGAFPTLFHDLDEAPPSLVRHFRYSRHLLDVQSRVLLQYHQEAPPVFHGQQDRWAVASQLSIGAAPVAYGSEYAMLTLPGEDEESWVLSTVFVPQDRQNLASFLAARWDPVGGSELLLWDIPVESQLRGPRQIDALVEQDPEISQQFSLWRQGGSEVWTGHLHLVPVGSTLIYMEPVFLAADHDAIPEIRRYVVSDGNRVIMDPTLDGAVTALALGMEGIVRDEADEPTPFLPVEDLVAVDLSREADTRGARDALRLLEEAETYLRNGDWEGFGRKLGELRELLLTQAGDG
jgi:uncharacterized protein